MSSVCVYIFQAKKGIQSPAKDEDPVKAVAKCVKWTYRADQFVHNVNKVLRAPVNQRNKVLAEMIDSMKLPARVVDKLQLGRFLDGRMALWNEKHIMTITEGKPGYLTCAVCETDYKWSKAERMFLHLVCDRHQMKCQERLDAVEKEKRQGRFVGECAAAASAIDIVKRVQDYAIQYCAAKSLPFTAATMALDCVTAAVNTLVPKQFSPTAIAELISNGHRSEAKMLRHINYAAKAVDTGGKIADAQKRKSTQTKGNVTKKKVDTHVLGFDYTGRA